MNNKDRIARRKSIGLCCVYVVTTKEKRPTKVGLADNVQHRLDGLQSGNWARLVIFDYWYLETRGIAQVVERETKEMLHEGGYHLRGEWFDVPAQTARIVVARVIERNGYKAVREDGLCQRENEMLERAIEAIEAPFIRPRLDR